MEHRNVVIDPQDLITKKRSTDKGGAIGNSKSLADVTMHPSAFKFCDEATKEKLALLREYRRMDMETGQLLPTDMRSSQRPDPTHPALKTLRILIQKANDPDATPAISAKFWDRIAQMVMTIEKTCVDIAQSYVDNQFKLANLAQKGKDMVGQDSEEAMAMEDAQLIEEARRLGVPIPEDIARFLEDRSEDDDSEEGDNGP